MPNRAAAPAAGRTVDLFARSGITRALLAAVGLGFAVTVRLAAQSSLTVELGGSLQSLSGPYGDGGAVGLRATWQRPRDVWTAFASHERRFGTSGQIGGVGNTHTISANWYSYLAASASTDAFFLPRYRLDGQLSRKLGAARQWVLSASAMAWAAHDEHRDVAAGVGLIRYFDSGFVLDGAVLWNRSTPGAVVSRRHSLTAMYAQPGRQTASARVSWGREAYQLTGSPLTLTGFASQEVSVRYQRWLTRNAGATVTAEYYDNPYYSRTGLYLTIFRQYGQ